ncbi:MAG: cysteine peptidase family C39 domain-containing protein [Gemmataceae bacterium]
MLSLVPSVANAIKRWLRLHALTGYLRDRSFLGFMSAETALEFLEDLTPQVFAPGQTIQAERLGDDRWHFLESGEVVLHADGGTFRIGAGDCFGEESLAGLPIVRHAEAVGVVKTRSLFVARFLPQEQGLTASQQTQAGRLALDFPWVGQETPSDCGFASLAMICAAWKRNAPPASWRAEVSSRGLSMAAMKTALERLGFAVRAIRIEALQLRAARTPVILLMREDHYMVLFDAGADGVTIADPATATLRWSWPALESQFSGFALLPQPID